MCFKIRTTNYFLMLFGFNYHIHFSKTKNLILYSLTTKVVKTFSDSAIQELFIDHLLL